jgi:thiosulfate/3-mercaptopyruvate sulfurtransferase
MPPLITPEELKQLMVQSGLVIVDAQTGPSHAEDYASRHISRAQHVGLDTDLSEKPADPAHGGRHPLPELRKFAELLGRLGITPSSHVVVYDNKHGVNAAARFWWMLRAAGHERVQVLNGGLQAAVVAGIPVTDEITPAQESGPYPLTGWKQTTVTLDEVKQAIEDPRRLLIDVREGYRFRGESEPFDLVAGHIPNAINVPFKKNLSEDGFFLPSDELNDLYASIIGSRNPADVIVSCGSGVTACHTLLAMEAAGIRGPRLYVGSWSEWSRNNLPVAKGE